MMTHGCSLTTSFMDLPIAPSNTEGVKTTRGEVACEKMPPLRSESGIGLTHLDVLRFPMRLGPRYGRVPRLASHGIAGIIMKKRPLDC
jgi:hypothetical protein